MAVYTDLKGKIIKPPKFPMKFKDFLRRAFGGRLHAERLRLFRKFLVSEYTYFSKEGEDKEDIPTKLISALSENGIASQGSYYGFVQQIGQWRAINKVQQRKDANKNRWLKENRKKILVVLQKRISDMSQAEKRRFAKLKAKKVTGSHLKK